MDQKLIDAKAAARTYLVASSNVVGLGIGRKKIKDDWTDCVRFYVIRRIEDEANIPPSRLLPKTVGAGVPVDVIEVGAIGRNGLEPVADTGTATCPGSPIRVDTNRPNVNEGVRGTLGAVVSDGHSNYILSCNHVLAVNGRVPPEATLANIVSAEFVGQQNPIATLDSFVKLRRDQANSADCALAALKDARSVGVTFPDETVRLSNATPINPQLGMRVSKLGAGTGLTTGSIEDCDVDLYVPYTFMDQALFEHQFVIRTDQPGKLFATYGDSGALVVDNNSGQPVGLIFASSGEFAIACPLTTVLAELEKMDRKVTILTAANPPAQSTVAG